MSEQAHPGKYRSLDVLIPGENKSALFYPIRQQSGLCLFAGLEGAQRCGQVPLTVWKMFLDASWKCFFFFLSFSLLSLVTDHKVSHVEFKYKPQ